jgi:hypothetical protein
MIVLLFWSLMSCEVGILFNQFPVVECIQSMFSFLFYMLGKISFPLFWHLLLQYVNSMLGNIILAWAGVVDFGFKILSVSCFCLIMTYSRLWVVFGLEDIWLLLWKSHWTPSKTLIILGRKVLITGSISWTEHIQSCGWVQAARCCA